MHVCFHGLVRLWPLAGASHSEKSAVILSVLLSGSDFPPDGDSYGTARLSPAGVHDLISAWPTCQTFLRSSRRQMFGVRPHPHRPPPMLASSARVRCSILSLVPGGARLRCTEVKQVNFRFMFGIMCERNPCDAHEPEEPGTPDGMFHKSFGRITRIPKKAFVKGGDLEADWRNPVAISLKRTNQIFF